MCAHMGAFRLNATFNRANRHMWTRGRGAEERVVVSTFNDKGSHMGTCRSFATAKVARKVTKWLQMVKNLTIVQVAQFWEKNFLNFCAIFYLTIFRKDGIMEVCGRPAARGAITFLKGVPAFSGQNFTTVKFLSKCKDT